MNKQPTVAGAFHWRPILLPTLLLAGLTAVADDTVVTTESASALLASDDSTRSAKPAPAPEADDDAPTPKPPAPPRAAAAEAPEPPETTDALTAQALDSAKAGLKVARDVARMAQAHVGGAMKRIHSDLAAVGRRELILPGPGASAEDLGQTEQDLAVMHKLLRKAAQPEDATHNGFRFSWGDFRLGDGRDLDSMYLGGYGAVFLLEVDYPLAALPRAGETASKPKQPEDPAWERAQRELAAENGGAADSQALVVGDDSGAETAYDAERVGGLVHRLTEALKHARNLKTLKPDERVVIQVTGAGDHESGAAMGDFQVLSDDFSGGSKVITIGGGARHNKEGGGRHRPSTLTIEAHKGLIDDYAAGRMDSAEFSRRVTVTVRENGAVRTPPKAGGAAKP